MYMMSRDHLSMHIDAASLQLMLQLLSVDSARQSTSNDDNDLCRCRQRLRDIVNQTGGHSTVTLNNMAVSLFLAVSFIGHPVLLNMCVVFILMILMSWNWNSWSSLFLKVTDLVHYM